MKYSFHHEAELELVKAIEYYEECNSGLGHDFAVEVYAAIERAAAFPKTWPFIEADIRRALIRRFPYGILYSEESDALFIVAVMNLHRDPDYWKARLY
ncbi:MAG: type II toxin-antitoxin system RelE/ParE family toxin [Nitrospirae bacterium]|nr:type II toxin-antitoxin system RelE/ParE family toxin [Nitrospirota bacterium]